MTYPVETSLCHSLQQGKLCYVIERETTKRTLRERVRAEMHSRGYHSIVIQMRSLTARGLEPQITWDQQFIQAIWQSLHPTNLTQLSRWLAATDGLSARERLTTFTGDLLFNELCAMPFVIFVEDIDVFLPSKDVLEEGNLEAEIIEDILFWIEYCYELRETYLTYHHLSFAVFGSTSISQIVSSTTHSLSNFENIVTNFQQLDISHLDSQNYEDGCSDVRCSRDDCASNYSGDHSGDCSNQLSANQLSADKLSSDRLLAKKIYNKVSSSKLSGDKLPSNQLTDGCSNNPRKSILRHFDYRRQLSAGPAFIRLQCAMEIAKMQVIAYRFCYDSPYCSRAIC